MSSTTVFAHALSRLHADVIIVRLKRAGIAPEKISALFPRRFPPNSVFCWLKGLTCTRHASAASISAAGPLREIFSHGNRPAYIAHQLELRGLPADEAHSRLEKVQEGQTLICVHATDEDEAAIAWHIFKHVEAEHISVSHHKNIRVKTPATRRAPVTVAPIPAETWAAA